MEVAWKINRSKFVCTVFARLSARCRCKLGNFSLVGVLAIFRFTAPVNDCRSEHYGRYCTFALSLFNLLRRSQIVKRSLIGQKYDHGANMNSESAKELLKWRNSVLVCTLGKRKGMWLCVSYFFWGEFFKTIALAIPPLTVKNRGGGVHLFRTVRLIGANTVFG